VINIRRREVSRIEGFSDAVFGFALTLLVASLEVPPDFAALKQTLRGFLPFALTFALISWIWYLHYSFFRQFGLEDRLTIVLNSILLFVVLFFVYPLKVMANALVGVGPNTFSNLTEYDNRFLMVAYSSGVIAVFGVFFLLNCNAYRQRHALALTLEDLYDINTALRAHASSTLLGVSSVILAITLPMSLFGLSGLVYALEGPLQGAIGWSRGSRRERVFPSSTPARP
jgi:uncharacterized membrane protein